MDREYFFGGFIVAALVAVIAARLLVARVEDSGLSRASKDGPHTTLYVQAAVLVLLWVVLSLAAQIVVGAAHASTELFDFESIFDGGSFQASARVRVQSIASGVGTGTNLGIGVGLVGFAFNALRVAMRARLPFEA